MDTIGRLKKRTSTRGRRSTTTAVIQGPKDTVRHKYKLATFEADGCKFQNLAMKMMNSDFLQQQV